MQPPSWLTDEEIEALVRLPKPLPKDYWEKLMERRARKSSYSLHDEGRITVPTEQFVFEVIVRVNSRRSSDYSIVLRCLHPSYGPIRLRKYHGPHRTRHVNKLEGTFIPAGQPHIHKATERYGRMDKEKHDHYAEPSQWLSLEDALHQFLSDCSFVPPPEQQLRLPLGG